jgi:hypothetical protein
MDFHIIVSGIEDADVVETLAAKLAGAGDDTSPALAIEKVIRGLGDEFWGAEVMEYATEEDGVVGMRNWL